MFDELTVVLRNSTWDFVSSQSSQIVLGYKWVFCIKQHLNGSNSRYKAWLVAKGFHQWPRVDYHGTFNPIIKAITVCLILSLVLLQGWSIWQLHVNNAFLHGMLTEEVYMEQPVGFVNSNHPYYVYKLWKVLYALKQALRAWYNELKEFLISFGFVYFCSDTSLFIYHHVPFLCTSWSMLMI